MIERGKAEIEIRKVRLTDRSKPTNAMSRFKSQASPRDQPIDSYIERALAVNSSSPRGESANVYAQYNDTVDPRPSDDTPRNEEGPVSRSPSPRPETPPPSVRKPRIRIVKTEDQICKEVVIREKATMKYMETVHYQYLQLRSADDWEELGWTGVAREMREIEKAKEAKEEKKADSDYAFLLTVNVKPGVTLEQLQTQVNKWVSRKPCQKGNIRYVYERRWANPSAPGYHVHILQTRDDRKVSDWKREAKSTFGQVCDANNPHCFNFKSIPYSQYAARLAYLQGKKKAEKLDYVQKDKEWRKDVGLQDLYVYNEGKTGTELED